MFVMRIKGSFLPVTARISKTELLVRMRSTNPSHNTDTLIEFDGGAFTVIAPFATQLNFRRIFPSFLNEVRMYAQGKLDLLGFREGEAITLVPEIVEYPDGTKSRILMRAQWLSGLATSIKDPKDFNEMLLMLVKERDISLALRDLLD